MRITGRQAGHAVRRIGVASAGILAAAALIPAGGSARAEAPPKATGEPTISGRPIEGNVLTASNGSFSGTGPFNYTYRWLRCPASGGGGNGQGCTVISGATFRRYAVRQADVGHRLRVRVTAANSEGSASATSNATGVVQAATVAGPPRNTAPPSISGTPQVGQTLTANNGTWVGQQPVTFTYHWRRCDTAGASCSDISGATAKTYVLTAADQGTTLRVRVTAHNARGVASSTSPPTGVVAKAEAPGGSTVSVNEVSLPNRLLVDRVTFSPQPLTSRRTITVRFHVSDSRNHSVQGAMVFVVAMPFGTTTTPPESATGSDGWVTFRMRPTARVKFGHGGSIPMFVRARKPGERLIGGVSTRRLVNLSTR
jgi:hypothetical protein